MEKHPGFKKEVEEAVKRLMNPFLNRPNVLFVSEKDSCRSHMAAAFTQLITKGEVAVYTSGITPSNAIDPEMEKAMAEKGIDVAFRRPQIFSQAVRHRSYDKIIFLDEGIDEKYCDQATKTIRWSVENPGGKDPAAMRKVRDGLAAQVRSEFQ